MTRAAEFFTYARERQSVLIKKTQGLPKPWTQDYIIQGIKFCNVFREDDVTTKHLRAITEPMRDKPEVFLATILYRWFNRMTTGDAIFIKNMPFADGMYPVFKMWDDFNDPQLWINWIKQAILFHCGDKGPYVTGAYCIIGAPHMPKIDGILRCFQNVLEEKRGQTTEQWPGNPDKLVYSWREVAELCLAHPGEILLESVWDWFRRYPRSGDFMAYEVVTDLCYTDILKDAPDRMTWANAGPGAIRGLNRIHERPLNQQHHKTKTNLEMHELLKLSQDNTYWPEEQMDPSGYFSFSGNGLAECLLEPDMAEWPTWDMRTVEHTLCEFDKYERIRLGEGSVKGVYRGMA